jgi:hypothetical protein
MSRRGGARDILRELDCRSRVEAAHRAGELGLLA